MWEFLKNHRELAVAYNKSAYDRENSKRHWQKLAKKLNSISEGAKKSGAGWSKYWVDFKAKLKRKVKQVHDSANEQGTTELSLSEVEMNFLSILGKKYGSNLLGIQALPADEQKPDILLNDSPHPAINSPSQPTTSKEGAETPFKTLWMNMDMDDNNLLSDDTQSREASPALSSSTASEEPSKNTSGIQSGNTNNPRHRIGKRRIRRRSLTAAAAIEKLVVAAQVRAKAEKANSESIRRAVIILGEMTTVLKRIERRLTLDDSTSD
ncbi:unnamed protein product [Chilo suppressalis]|uniref:Regulatory protein zeste n=1 Tax=Chilo suppressalis TaxID=168631 RepID=A0ABN8AVU8_CHISP|nr:unnamed protein product [Chilo suppressalis]